MPWSPGTPAPFVEIIVPARNEERNIEALLDTLVVQRYPQRCWGITVVNDHSTDRTTQVAERYATASGQVRVVTARELPPGWTGKNNAMYSGYLAAPSRTRYLLFVDADTRYHDMMLATLVREAETHGAALTSLVLDIALATFWQRLLVPQVGELYALLTGTMDSVNQGKAVAANGQCMLVKYDQYVLYGNDTDVRQDVAEDRALASAIRRGGGIIRLEHGELLGSVRPYPTFGDAWAGYAKTLYWASGRNTARTIAAVLALEMYAHLPWWSVFRALSNPRYPHRQSALANAPLQLIPMLALRLSVCRLMGIPASYALAYPLAAAIGNAILLYSWLRSRSGQGVQWKGRSYK